MKDDKKKENENHEVLKDYGPTVGTIVRINLVQTGSLVVFAQTKQN